jgi:cysteine synthase
MVAPVVESVIDLTRGTPLVRLAMGGPASVWAKCEHLLPSGSIKDRSADAALARSGAERGGSVVVASSGSTAAALAIAGKLRGVKIVAAMPRSMALEKRSLLRGLGVELVLTDAELGPAGAVAAAERIASERGLGRIVMDDADGARGAAEEIREALDGLPEVLVVGVGSGATLRAMSAALRGHGALRVIGVMASQGDTRLAGLSSSATPGADELRTIDDARAWHTSRRLAREEGLLVGPSAGACVAVACDVASTLPASARVCTLLPDTGERYFSIASFFPAEGAP